MLFLKTLLLCSGFFFMFPSFAEVSADEILKNYTMPQGYSEVKQSVAHALIEKKIGVVFDVRTKEEYDDGHIEGAINLDSVTFSPAKVSQYVKDKQTPILIYCRSGRRATGVGQALARDGYKYVLNFGGVNTWAYDLVKDTK